MTQEQKAIAKVLAEAERLGILKTRRIPLALAQERVLALNHLIWAVDREVLNALPQRPDLFRPDTDLDPRGTKGTLAKAPWFQRILWDCERVAQARAHDWAANWAGDERYYDFYDDAAEYDAAFRERYAESLAETLAAALADPDAFLKDYSAYWHRPSGA